MIVISLIGLAVSVFVIVGFFQAVGHLKAIRGLLERQEQGRAQARVESDRAARTATALQQIAEVQGR